MTKLLDRVLTLLYCNDDLNPAWGWWCRRCTTGDDLVCREGFRTRDGAVRSARAHEEGVHGE
jgi:hypothetical protein